MKTAVDLFADIRESLIKVLENSFCYIYTCLNFEKNLIQDHYRLLKLGNKNFFCSVSHIKCLDLAWLYNSWIFHNTCTDMLRLNQIKDDHHNLYSKSHIVQITTTELRIDDVIIALHYYMPYFARDFI